MKKISLGGFAITFIGAILFSTKAIIVKKAFADTSIDALTLLTLRMIFSLPFFLGAAWFVSSQKHNVRLTAVQWIGIVVLGIFGYYLSSFFDFYGLQYISAGLERLILFLYPTFVVIINRLAFGVPIKKMQVVALALTYTGIGLAYIDEMQLDTSHPKFFVGSIMVFFCAITYAVYIAGSGKLIPLIGATKFTAYAMLSATAGIFVHFLVAGNSVALRAAGGIWYYGLTLAIVATVLPTFLLSAGMLLIGSNNAAIISSVGPVSTILQAHWVLGEPTNRGQIIGTVLVIAGVLLAGWKTKNAAAPEPAVPPGR